RHRARDAADRPVSRRPRRAQLRDRAVPQPRGREPQLAAGAAVAPRQRRVVDRGARGGVAQHRRHPGQRLPPDAGVTRRRVLEELIEYEYEHEYERSYSFSYSYSITSS